MTTAWANVARGRLVDAVRTHATGTVLAVLALVVSIGALTMAVRGQRLAWQPGETVLAGLALAMTGLILCEWTIRLWAH